MTPAYGCTELHEDAVELALGILGGRSRAEALAHLDRCPDCRALVNEYADAVDVVVSATPTARPPRGFARRAVRRLARASARAPRPRRARVLAAAALVALGLTLVVELPSSPHGTPQVPAALSAPGVHVARLAPTASGPTSSEQLGGVVFVHNTAPAWVFMTVSGDEDSSRYACQLVRADGTTVSAGSVAMHHGAGTWRWDVPAGASPITAVNVLGKDGAVLARATLG
jgi:hypothetical protein